jgi:hypothetical protein
LRVSQALITTAEFTVGALDFLSERRQAALIQHVWQKGLTFRSVIIELKTTNAE